VCPDCRVAGGEEGSGKQSKGKRGIDSGPSRRTNPIVRKRKKRMGPRMQFAESTEKKKRGSLGGLPFSSGSSRGKNRRAFRGGWGAALYELAGGGGREGKGVSSDPVNFNPGKKGKAADRVQPLYNRSRTKA